MRTLVLSGILILLLICLSPAAAADTTQTPTVNITTVATTTPMNTVVPVDTTEIVTSTPVPFVSDGSHYDIHITSLDVLAQAVTLVNNGTLPVPLDNWFIVNSGISQIYTFPNFTLQPNATVIVYTGTGVNSATSLYWGLNGTVWNPNGDTATLFDDFGTVISVCSATPGGATPTPVPTTVVTTIPTSAHGTPRYHAGDVIWTDYTRQDKYWVILAYDNATDKYGRSVILPNRDGTWGHLVTPDILWDDRLYVETYYPVLMVHLDPQKIVIGDFTVGTPTPGPTVTPTPDPRSGGFTAMDIFKKPADADYKRTHQTGPKINFIRWYPPWARG
jgi:hypothetical protein